MFEDAAIWEADAEGFNGTLVSGYVWGCCGAPAADEGCMSTAHKVPATYKISVAPATSSTLNKRKREDSPAATSSSDGFATCQNCFLKFDKMRNEHPAREGECIYHWGEKAIGWRTNFWCKNGIVVSSISVEDSLDPEYQEKLKKGICGPVVARRGVRLGVVRRGTRRMGIKVQRRGLDIEVLIVHCLRRC